MCLVEMYCGCKQRNMEGSWESGGKVLKYSVWFCWQCETIKRSRYDQTDLGEIAWGKDN